jgi:hypothetical protein
MKAEARAPLRIVPSRRNGDRGEHSGDEKERHRQARRIRDEPDERGADEQAGMRSS